MALFRIDVTKNPADVVTFWETKNSAKAAYELGVSKGLDIFGEAPYSVRVTEEKPAT